MELKVWVEGIQRIVCGVTVNTTCQDVVFALAHATGKVGRFTLIERWRNNERLLAPNENPLKLLLKWGEYANDVQFILQRSENKQQQQTQPQQQQQQQTAVIEATAGGGNNNNNNNNNNVNTDLNRNSQTINAVMTKKPLGLSNTINNNNNNNCNNNSNNNNNNNNKMSNMESSALNVQQQHQQQQKLHNDELLNYNTTTHDKAKELKKSFGSHDVRHNENIGIVRGIPQRHKTSPTISNNSSSAATITTAHSSPTLPHFMPKHEKSHSNPIEMSSSSAAMHFTTTTTTGAQGRAGFLGENNHHNNNNNNNSGNTNNIYQQLGAHNSKSINEINLAVVRNSLDQRTTTTTNESSEIMLFNTPNLSNNNNSNNNNNKNNISSSNGNSSNETLLDIYNGNTKFSNNNNNNNSNSSDLYKNTPTISANGALVPPPYRNPPPPRNSPLQMQHSQLQQQIQPQQQQHASPAFGQNISTNPFINDYSQDYDFEYQNLNANSGNNSNNNNNNNNNNNIINATSGGGGAMSISMEESESIFQATQYNDLLQLIKFQREKISAQQMELSKYDAEIVYLETKERDQAQELEAISREITKADQIFRQGSEQLQTLQYVEEENELVKQQEKTLKSEIALLRSKLANCETELLQCKNKIRILMDDIEVEQRAITNKQKTNRQNVERDFLMEMERIQSEIDQAIHNTDTSNKTAENLKKEILLIENAIAEKKRQVEQLVNEMKEVNLQSLTVTTSEEIKHLLEGSNKPGSSRRIIGSPRQLENAVPTSKNPHGVWV